jgi:hypothetical protein
MPDSIQFEVGIKMKATADDSGGLFRSVTAKAPGSYRDLGLLLLIGSVWSRRPLRADTTVVIVVLALAILVRVLLNK